MNTSWRGAPCVHLASYFQSKGDVRADESGGRVCAAGVRAEPMLSTFLRLLVVITLHTSLLSFGQDSQPKISPGNGGDFSTVNQSTQGLTKVPTGVILVKGAWS